MKASKKNQDIESEFLRLRDRWREETFLVSSNSDLILNPNYQRIIDLGPDIIPILLKELQEEPDHWGWALHVLTGENPVPDSAIGNLELITQAWLDWGIKKGYLS